MLYYWIIYSLIICLSKKDYNPSKYVWNGPLQERKIRIPKQIGEIKTKSEIKAKDLKLNQKKNQTVPSRPFLKAFPMWTNEVGFPS